MNYRHCIRNKRIFFKRKLANARAISQGLAEELRALGTADELQADKSRLQDQIRANKAELGTLNVRAFLFLARPLRLMSTKISSE